MHSPRTPQSGRKRSRSGSRTPSNRDGDNPSSPGILPAIPESPMALDAPMDHPATPAPAIGSEAGISEIGLSSPLCYGTPSSHASLRTPRSVAHGTPTRVRSDIRSTHHVRQVQVTATSEQSEVQQPSSDVGSGPQLVIWGTDVNVNKCKEKFKKFILRFVCGDLADDERIEGADLNSPLYLQKLEEIHTLEEPFLNVNCNHLKIFDENLYRQLVNYPQEVIPTFDLAINELFFDRYPEAHLQFQIQVRPYNADKTRNMRSLNPEDIDQLITISGMVIRSSNIIPEMREAFFRCHVCSHTVTVEIDHGRITEPTLCTHCNTHHSFGLIHNRSQFTDKQMVKLQESPDDMPPGQTPYTIVLFAHNDLVDVVNPGDRVTVTGIYRAIPIRINPRQRNVKSVYKTHIDVVHFRKTDVKRLHEDTDEKHSQFSPLV